MFNTLLSITATFGLPFLKWLWGRKEKREISDKEFGELIAAHMQSRSGAGQTALDGEDAVANLEARLAKKK